MRLAFVPEGTKNQVTKVRRRLTGRAMRVADGFPEFANRAEQRALPRRLRHQPRMSGLMHCCSLLSWAPAAYEDSPAFIDQVRDFVRTACGPHQDCLGVTGRARTDVPWGHIPVLDR